MTTRVPILMFSFVLMWLAVYSVKAQDRDCTLPADLFFVIDGSNSLSDAEFNASKAFVVDVLSEFNVGRGAIHVGANVFGSDVSDRVQLHGPTIYPLFLKRISALIRTPFSGTATFLAIEEMTEEFKTNGRADVTRVGVVITDGKSINTDLTYQKSLEARASGINTIAIGVGNNIFRPELAKIAGDPKHEFVTAIISDVVELIQNPIKDFACEIDQSLPISLESGDPKHVFVTANISDVVELIQNDIKDFTPELANIAGDPKHVFVTANISDVVELIQNAIKDFTCERFTTTQATTTAGSDPTTTPEPANLGPDFDCPDCMIDKNHGFQQNDRYCQKYYELIGDGSGTLKKIPRKCRDGLFWDQYHLSCKRPEQVNCPNDPCKNTAIASYAIDGMCSGYVACVGGRSFWACCDVIQRYVPGTGCVTDPSCNDACDSSSETNLQEQEECRNFPHATNRKMYIEVVPFHGNFTRSCAPGTIFDVLECGCIHDDAPPSGKLADCNPATNLTFETNFADSTGHFYAGSEFVSVENGQAVFRGNGMLNIYRFSGDDFGTSLVISFRFYDLTSGAGQQALVTNCVYSSDLSASLSITTSNNRVVFVTDTELQRQDISISYNTIQNTRIGLPNADLKINSVGLHKNAWNDVIYIYDGKHMTAVVNGQKDQKPLTGRVLIRRSGIILGAGSQLNHFTGTFDEFQLYKCFPAFADAYRT